MVGPPPVPGRPTACGVRSIKHRHITNTRCRTGHLIHAFAIQRGWPRASWAGERRPRRNRDARRRDADGGAMPSSPTRRARGFGGISGGGDSRSWGARRPSLPSAHFTPAQGARPAGSGTLATEASHCFSAAPITTPRHGPRLAPERSR
jgi:hypothetical protein